MVVWRGQLEMRPERCGNEGAEGQKCKAGNGRAVFGWQQHARPPYEESGVRSESWCTFEAKRSRLQMDFRMRAVMSINAGSLGNMYKGFNECNVRRDGLPVEVEGRAEPRPARGLRLTAGISP